MEKRVARWFAAGALVMALASWLVGGTVRPSTVHAEDQPTPTPTETVNDPGGQGGGGY